MARRQREYNGRIFSDDGTGKLFNAELKKYLIYRPYPILVDEVNESNKVEPDNKQEYTSEQLKTKFGTDDTELINTGREKEDHVAKVEDEKHVLTLSGDYERDNHGNIITKEQYDEFRDAYKKDLISREDYKNDNYDALKNIQNKGDSEDDDYTEYKFKDVYDLQDEYLEKEFEDEVEENLDDTFETSDLYNAINNGILNQEEVNEMALRYVSYDDIIYAMRMLDYYTDEYSSVDDIFNDGNLDDSDLDRIGYEVLAGMSSDDLKDMLRLNDINLKDLI